MELTFLLRTVSKKLALGVGTNFFEDSPQCLSQNFSQLQNGTFSKLL